LVKKEFKKSNPNEEEVDANKASFKTNLRYIDPPLTEQGKIEIEGTKATLSEISFDYVFVSPLRRTLETA
jgi:broad specificity phosphatase PhoE